MKLKRLFWMSFLAFTAIPQWSWGSADFAEDLRLQVVKLKKQYVTINTGYFHDIGIVARKADDAGLPALVSEILRGLLLDSDLFIEGEIEKINDRYEKEPLQASQQLQKLMQPERYFQPTEDFQKTSLGRALNGDIIQFRTNALEALAAECSSESILQGAQAIKRTALYLTNQPAEIDSMRKLTDAVNGCIAWRSELVFTRSQEFETLYEKGRLTEEAHLRLESSRSDLSQARWVGPWVQRYTGRDGKGEGVSQAVLTYRKGEDLAGLIISTSRVSSTGRMNFPNSFSGEKRSLEVSGAPIHPLIVFYGQKMKMTGAEKK